jgi:hypothetical protein
MKRMMIAALDEYLPHLRSDFISDEINSHLFLVDRFE